MDVFDFFQHNTLFASSDSADEQAQEEELYIEDYDIHASYQTKDLRSTYESLPKRPKQDDYAIWNIAPCGLLKLILTMC